MITDSISAGKRRFSIFICGWGLAWAMMLEDAMGTRLLQDEEVVARWAVGGRCSGQRESTYKGPVEEGVWLHFLTHSC